MAPRTAHNTVPTHVAVEPSPGVSVGTPRYPQPSSFSLAGRQIATFAEAVDVRVPLGITADATPGDRRLRGTLRYQPCTETRCLFPTTLPFEVVVHVSAQ